MANVARFRLGERRLPTAARGFPGRAKVAVDLYAAVAMWVRGAWVTVATRPNVVPWASCSPRRLAAMFSVRIHLRKEEEIEFLHHDPHLLRRKCLSAKC